MTEKRTKYTSPKGEFLWPKLTVPDTKFKAEGEYGLRMRVAENVPGVAQMIARIDAEAAESLKAAQEKAKTPKDRKAWETKYLPYEREEDEEGNPTGNVIFKASMKASGVSKKTGKPWKRKPALFDARGVTITKVIEVGNGTIGKFSYEIIPYAPTTQIGASVKLALEGAQIIELKSFGEQKASDHGFGAEEGGFSAEDLTDAKGGDFDDTTGGDDGDASGSQDSAAEQRDF